MVNVRQRVYVYQSGNIEADLENSAPFQYGHLQDSSQNIQNLNLPWNLALSFTQPATDYQNQQIRNRVSVRSSDTAYVLSGNQFYIFNVTITLRSTRMLDYWSTILGYIGGQNNLITILTNALTYSIQHNHRHATYNIASNAQPYLLLAQFDIDITLPNL
jgi:hypothetical protein